MPFYEYQCESCSYEFEALQKINDAPLTSCPKCQKNHLQKLISAPRFKLQGNGWYETDFKGKSSSESETSADSSSQSSSTSSESTSTEAQDG